MMHFGSRPLETARNPSSSDRSVFPQLTKMNVEAQRVERELRDELADCISKTVSDADRARIAELEKTDAELRIEVSKYVLHGASDIPKQRHVVVSCVSYFLILFFLKASRGI